MKRYGPYKLPTKHLFFIDISETGAKKSVLVHREVMEQAIGRKLLASEVVHHKDHNPENNALENLEIKDWVTHAKDHGAERIIPPAEMTCLYCKSISSRLAKELRRNQVQKGYKGPFCTRSCAAKWQWENTSSMFGHNKSRPIKHGTPSAYSYSKCRCSPCTIAIAQQRRLERQRKRTRIGT